LKNGWKATHVHHRTTSKVSKYVAHMQKRKFSATVLLFICIVWSELKVKEIIYSYVLFI